MFQMRQRWIHEDGILEHDMDDAARTVYDLIAPSRERALMLNKAYRVIVNIQDFMFGRDATVTPPKNVFESMDNSKTPPLLADKFIKWDILLN